MQFRRITRLYKFLYNKSIAHIKILSLALIIPLLIKSSTIKAWMQLTLSDIYFLYYYQPFWHKQYDNENKVLSCIITFPRHFRCSQLLVPSKLVWDYSKLFWLDKLVSISKFFLVTTWQKIIEIWPREKPGIKVFNML